jgi:hypothetical protein
MSVAPGQTLTGLKTYDNVVAVTASTILLAAPATAPGSAASVLFTPDNGGSSICDGEPTPYIYNRATFSYGPKDWGAFGGGLTGDHDDTVPLANWLNAPQPHVGDIDRYVVTAPLNCSANTTIQGPSNVSGSGSPLFSIIANNDSTLGPVFSGQWSTDGTILHQNVTQAVLTGDKFCRISGVGIDAGGFVSVLGTGSFSNNSSTINSVTNTANLQIGNTVVANGVPPNTTVSTIVGATVTMTQNYTGSGGIQSVTFYGPDAFDVEGRRVAVDGFSALINGSHNLDCGDNGPTGGLQLKDSEFISSLSDNVYLTSGCSNARLIGDIISTAGVSTNGTHGDPNARGVVFQDKDITIADGVIEQSNGTGLAEYYGDNPKSVPLLWWAPP